MVRTSPVSLLSSFLLLFLLMLTTCGKDSPTGPPAPSSVTVTPASVTLTTVGQTVQLYAKVEDRNGKVITGATVTWTSSNASVASVSPTGLVTAHKIGTTSITASISGVSRQAIVKVEVPVVTNIVLTATNTLMNALGQTQRIAARVRDQRGLPLSGIDLTWSSSDTTVASVDSTGVATAVGNGASDIMASAGTTVGTLRITVEQRPARITVSTTSITLTVGATHQLKGTVLDSKGHVIPGALPNYSIYAPDHRSVVQIDRSGLIIALKEGTATIAAGLGGPFAVSIVVTVVGEGTIVQPTVAAVTLSPTFFTMAVGDTLRFVAQANNADGQVVADAVFSWTSSDESVAVVDSDGLVTALMRGLTTIGAAVGRASASARLTVTPSERLSLVVLYDATNGSSWTNSDGWLSDGPLDEWYGVATDIDGQVTGLGLNGNNLEGAIPPVLGDLVRLETLDLGSNALSGPIPLELTRLDLSTLILEDTQTCVPEYTEIIGWVEGIAERRITGYCGQQDREVLFEVYKFAAAYGQPHTDLLKLNWLSDAPLNEWYGVTTNRDGHVTELVLYDRVTGRPKSLNSPIPPMIDELSTLESLGLVTGMSGPIPPELGNLSNLKFLSLHNNDLQGPIPPELGNLTNLEDFHLYYNHNLGGQIPPELGNLAKLDTLILIGNNLSGQIPPELGNMASLEDSSLSRNNLSGLIPPELGKLSKLVKLNIADNHLTGSIPLELGKLSNLEKLLLSDNQLSGYVPRELGRLSKLDNLGLRNNQLSEAIPPVLGDLAILRTLTLSGNSLSGPIPVNLSNLTNLVVLSLGNNQLSGTIPPELGSMTNMRWLSLEDNNLVGSIPPEISKLKYLRSLTLNGNPLSGAIPFELSRLVDLNTLRLDGTQVCAPADTEFQVWLQGIENLGPQAPSPCENPDLNVLAALYDVMNGSNWIRQENWLSDLSLSEWYGVETDANGRVTALNLENNRLFGPITPTIGVLTQLTRLSLSGNNLRGRMPVALGLLEDLVELNLSENSLIGNMPDEFGNLVQLERLDLSDNGLLNGAIPDQLTQLGHLSFISLDGTQLCVPLEDRFRTWLDGITDKNFVYCEGERQIHPRAYLTQAVQSLDSPVPLIADEPALLRVFATTGGREIDVEMPLVRATFYNDGVMVQSIELPGKPTSVPYEIDEGMANSSANVLVPASVVQPGLEMVIEIDPDGTLDPAHGIGIRLPDSGRMSVEVTDVPPLHLTMVPFLWYDQPDRTILRKIETLTPEDDLFWPTRDLLPVRDFDLNVRDYVWTSVDPIAENISEIARETRAIRVQDGADGHYMGVLRDIKEGIGEFRGRTSVVSLHEANIAHELGHNMGLNHAPCSPTFRYDEPLGITDIDPNYPYNRGTIGVWGYDSELRTANISPDHFFEYGTIPGKLVDPEWFNDIMGYCSYPWISDYHFKKAIEYRLTEEAVGTTTMAASSRSLLIWGGVDTNGDLVLEPAFVLEEGASISFETGPYRILGLDAEGHVLFSTSFAMDVMEDSEVQAFAFALPIEPSWQDRLSWITLSGPEGVVTIGRESDRAMAMLLDRFTGQVRGFLRDLPVATGEISARRMAPEPGLDLVISRGVPALEEW